MVTKKPLPRVTLKPEAPVKFYRRIVFSFIVLTGLLVVLAAYFILSKAEITVTLAKEPVSVDFIADLKKVTGEGGESPEEAVVPGSASINGQLVETTVSASKEYQTTGKKKIDSEVGGVITVINNYNKDQPLVATTRFLSPEGVLFRTKKRIDVPAGGKVDVEVYADPPTGEAAKLGPTKFTIPGLWEGLQDKIYGQSFSPMHGGEEEVGFVTQTDLDNAYNDLTQTLSNQVMDLLKIDMKASGEILGKVVIKEINEKRSNLKVGDTGDKFTVYLKLKVVGLAFYKRDLEGLAYNQLLSKVPEGKELINVDYNALNFLIEKYDLKVMEANMMVHLDGEMILRRDNPIFDKDKFIGLSREKIIQYLSVYPEIERITIKFSPFWVKKVPQLKNNVILIIK